MDESKPAVAPAEPAVPPPEPPAKKAATVKAQRLAAALRDNLKRRKAAGLAGRTEKPRN